MKLARYVIVVFILLTTAIFPNILAISNNNNQEIISSGTYGKGYRYNVQGWVYLHIEGEPYERGYQYGYLASAEIVDMMKRWSNFGQNMDFMGRFIYKQFLKNYDELSEKFWNLCKERGMKFFWDQYPEEYQEEIKGIADGIRDRGGMIHGHPVEYQDVFTLNVVEETLETYGNPGGRGRPFKTFLNQIKSLLKSIFNKESQPESKDQGYCMAFMATGDATFDGRLIASHSLVIASYMAQRTNMILDVQPSEGHRFVMTVFPGYIWSSQDFHENDAGIILMETVIWPPIGPWDVKGTTPVGVRVRKAIQYSDSIDDVIQTFLDGNNGLYPSDWLIGDAKTGEIASLELGLYNHAVTRTKNGYIWSCCNVKDDKVRWEQWSIFRFGIIGRFMPYFNKYKPSNIDKKFMELGDKYYGKIDVDIVKEIMSTSEICSATTDCKITDTELIKDLGLWAHQGRPDGAHYLPNSQQEEKFRGVVDNPGKGWLKVYASTSQPNDLPIKNDLDYPKKESRLLWAYETENQSNRDYGNIESSENAIYVATSSNSIFALNSSQGKLIWEKQIAEKSLTPTVSEGSVFVGTKTGIQTIDKDTGSIRWEKEVGEISSKPVIADDIVIAGCSDGDVCGFDVETGALEWSCKFSGSTTLSEAHGDIIYVCSEDACYAFNMKDREIKWKFETDGIITANPLIKNNIVYVGSWDGNLYAINSKTGKVKWIYETGWGIDTTPAVSDGLVFFGSMDNNFYAIDEKTGDLKWHFTCLSGIHSSPVAYGDFVFFGSDDGRFYALNKLTGDLEWNFAPGFTVKTDDVNNFITTPILSKPVIVDGVVYISAKGNVYALDVQTVETPKEKIGETKDYDIILIFITLAAVTVVLLLIYLQSRRKEGGK